MVEAFCCGLLHIPLHVPFLPPGWVVHLLALTATQPQSTALMTRPVPLKRPKSTPHDWMMASYPDQGVLWWNWFKSGALWDQKDKSRTDSLKHRLWVVNLLLAVHVLLWFTRSRTGYIPDTSAGYNPQGERVFKNMVDVYDGILKQELHMFLVFSSQSLVQWLYSFCSLQTCSRPMRNARRSSKI